MDSALIILSILAVILSWIFVKVTGSRLRQLGIPHDKPLPLVGNLLSYVTGQESEFNIVARQYGKFKDENIFGIYGLFGKCKVTLKHPALLKQMMIKDFDNFVNRGFVENSLSHDDLFGRSVLLLKNREWKDMRAMLSPLYTSSKMRYLFGLLVETGNEFISHHEKLAARNGGTLEIEAHHMFARVTVDGIFSTLLGFKSDCIRNEKSETYEVVDQIEKDFVAMFTEKNFFHQKVHDFFKTTILGEINRRREGKIVRPDVIQLLVEILNGKLETDSEDVSELGYNGSKSAKKLDCSDDDLVAQAFIFFIGEFDTTTTLLQSLSFELTKHPEFQTKLAEEVDKMLEKLDGRTITFEELNSMKFLEMVVNEGLRKWPSFRMISRTCNKETVFYDEETGKKYKIEKGVDVVIPILFVQRDPKFYSEPEKFDPYRFSDENKHKIVPGSFLTFGLGPRVCLGNRYALMEAKLVLFDLISKFSIEKCDKTPENLTHNSGNTGYNEKVYVNLKLRAK